MDPAFKLPFSVELVNTTMVKTYAPHVVRIVTLVPTSLVSARRALMACNRTPSITRSVVPVRTLLVQSPHPSPALTPRIAARESCPHTPPPLPVSTGVTKMSLTRPETRVFAVVATLSVLLPPWRVPGVLLLVSSTNCQSSTLSAVTLEMVAAMVVCNGGLVLSSWMVLSPWLTTLTQMATSKVPLVVARVACQCHQFRLRGLWATRPSARATMLSSSLYSLSQSTLVLLLVAISRSTPQVSTLVLAVLPKLITLCRLSDMASRTAKSTSSSVTHGEPPGAWAATQTSRPSQDRTVFAASTTITPSL